MKIKIKKNIFYNYYAIFIIAFYCLGMDQFLSYPLGLQPKIIWLLAFISTAFLYVHKARIADLIRNSIIKWLLAYFMISIGTVLYADNFAEGIMYVLSTLIISIPVIVIVLSASEKDQLYIIQKFPIILILASLSILIDANYSITQSIDIGSNPQSDRASGFYFNPNAAAMAISMLFLPALYASKSTIKQVLIVFTALLAILATVSRGGIFIFVILLFYASLFGVLSRRSLVLILSGFVVIFLASTIFIYYFADIFNIDKNHISRLGFLFGQSDISVMQDDYRLYLTLESFNRIFENPFFGCGVGCSFMYDADFMHSPHSMYLRFAMELGVIGLFLWISLIWIACNAKYGIKYGLGISIAITINSLFSHNLTEQSFIIVPLIVFSLCIPAIKKYRECIQ